MKTLIIQDIHPQSDSTVTVRTDKKTFEYWASGDAKYSHITDHKWINKCYGKPLQSISYEGNHLIIHGKEVITILIEPLHEGDEPVEWRGDPYPIK